MVESYVDKVVEGGKVRKIVIDHAGANKARNGGLKACTGDIVCAWDADCYIVPDYTAIALKELEKDEVDFEFCRYRFTDPSMGGDLAEPYDPSSVPPVPETAASIGGLDGQAGTGVVT